MSYCYIYITYIEAYGPVLKIWGQTEPTTPISIEKALSTMIPQFEQGHFTVTKENLRVDQVVCAKYKDGLYYRAIITNTSYLHDGMLEVRFMDYGNTDVISYLHVRTLSQHSPGLLTIPPQAQSFILAYVSHIGHSWDPHTITCINNELRYVTLQYVQIAQIGGNRLIHLIRDNEDVATIFVKKGLVTPVSLQVQQLFIEDYNKKLAVPVVSPMHRMMTSPRGFPQNPIIQTQSPVIHTSSPVIQQPSPQNEPIVLMYKSFSVEPYSTHAVYVSYVLDGPCQFSVQLKSMEEKLARLMSEINSMPLVPLDEIPLPGKVCLARCEEDDHICRAVVTNQVDNKYKIFFVDFGNTEVLKMEDLYEIPHSKILPKVMALRYALAGIERSTVTMEMKYAFKNFVSDKLLMMRAIPPVTRSSLPTCELWDENKTSVLDVIKRVAMNAYPEPLVLNRGFNQEVRVSYVFSCKQFFVQLKSKEEELNKLMLDLQESCNNSQPLPADMIKKGTPCCALFSVDNQWYRAQILDVDQANIKVRYVDYGNESVVPVGNLKVLQSKHILALRPQAIECCLNGYQNMTPDPARDNFLEEIILEKDFYMKVVEMLGTCVLVELIDSDKYNVASLLLDKIASSTSLISPLLVQDGNRVDHRKNPFQGQFSPKEHNFRQERKPLRDQNTKNWDEKSPNYDNRNFRSDSSSEENRQDFRNRGHKPNFNRQDSEREDGKRDFNNRGFSRNDGNNRNFNSRSDGKRDFDRNRNEGRRDFDRSDGRRDFDRNENRRDNRKEFNRFDNKKDFNRNEMGSRDYSKRDGNKNFGSRDFRNDNNRDFSRKDNRPPYNREKSWSSDGSKRNRNGFQKDGSEKSWSDHSDKSFKKSPRFNNNANKERFSNNFNNRNKFSPNSNKPNFKPQEEFEESFDVAPADAVYKTLDLTQQTKAVSISWFHNPSYFYCQLNESQEQFRSMMEEIQKVYPKRKPADMKTGAPVISLFPEDGVFYRGCIMQAQYSQFRVQYVDFGNYCTVDKVWPIDNKFMELPKQALCCGLSLNPPDGKWPQPDVFCQYFEKDEFVCNFLSKTDNKYIVDLIHDGNNVSQSLIAAGLGVCAESSVVEIEINILIRQQIKACVTDVKGANDFKLEIQKGCFVNAAMHNLAAATEVFEDNLKNLNDTFVIVYVDQIVDNRVEVTLYDLQGYKIEILRPDEGAIDSVWTLCGLPVFNPSLQGYVSWVTTNSIFIQPSGFEDTIAQLLESLYQYYSTADLESVKEPSEGNICAVHSSDSNWYRASITAIENESVTVMYLDYGNTETVVNTELRELLPEFTEMHALAIEVFIKEDPSKYQDQEVSVKLTNTEEGWVGEVEQVYEQQQQQPAVEEEIIQSDEPKEIENAVEEQQIESAAATESPEMNLQNGIAVVISHIDSPGEFYVQLKSDLTIIDSLQETIQKEIADFPELENTTAGVLCAAPYSVDSQWYRAQVLDADTDITTVRFVDFGNTDVLDNNSTHIKTLPSDLLALEQHARRCSLAIKPVEDDWSIIAHQRFESLAYEDETLQAEIIHQDEKTTYVELYVKNKNIANILIEEGLAVKLELEVDNDLTGFVSHFNSPSEFWIQLESSVADLEWIADQLSSANTFPELEDLAPGSLCAAIYSEDEQWYRARILSNTVAGIEVLFIDYGNSCTCSSLRELPEELVMLPALAQKCTLKKPPGIEQWTQQAIGKFKEISADGITIFKIHKMTTGETSEVELLFNGEDVSLMLLPKTVDGVVTKVDSLDSLWILKEDDKDPIECKLEPLPGLTWMETAISKFNEFVNKGNTVFQVEFLCDGAVRLYLNGRDIRYDLDTTKAVSSSNNTPKRSYIDPCISETVTELFNNAMDDAEKSENERNLDDTVIVEKMPDKTVIVDENEDVQKEEDKLPPQHSEIVENVNLVPKVVETFAQELVVEFNSKMEVAEKKENEAEIVLNKNNEKESSMEVIKDEKEQSETENVMSKNDVNESLKEVTKNEEIEESETENVMCKNDRKESSKEVTKIEENPVSNEEIENDTKSDLNGVNEKETCDMLNSSSVDEAASVKLVLTHSSAASDDTTKRIHSTPKSDDLIDLNSDSFLYKPNSASKRYNIDEKIVPGAIVRPQSPVEIEDYFSINDTSMSIYCDATIKEVKEEYFSVNYFEKASSADVSAENPSIKYVKISIDDRIVPGAISSPRLVDKEIPLDASANAEENFTSPNKCSLIKKLDFSTESSEIEFIDKSDAETESVKNETPIDISAEGELKNQTSSPYFTSMAFLQLENVKSEENTSAEKNEEDTERSE